MIRDQILAEIDATIATIKLRSISSEDTVHLYEHLGRRVVQLRGTSIAYRRSERKKERNVREALHIREAGIA